MSKLYSIQESTLTDIGDALRGKYGETRPGTIQVPCVIAKSSNVTDLNNYGFMPSGKTYNVVRIPGATKIKVNLYYMTSSDGFGKVYVASGEYESNIPTDIKYSGHVSPTLVELEFDNTEVITFCLDAMYIKALGYYAECIGYDADGNPIEVEGCSYLDKEVEVPNTYSSADVAAAIEGLGMMPEPIVLTGNQTNGCNSVIAANYIRLFGDTITTENISNASYMFSTSPLELIPFDINMSDSYHSINSMFYSCKNLKELPKIYNATPASINEIFSSCYNLREIPEDYFDNCDFSHAQNNNSYSMASVFNSCYSLRKLPSKIIKLFWNKANGYYYKPYSNMFTNCYVIDEIVDIMTDSDTTITSNMFNMTFRGVCRAKKITFAIQEDGSPRQVNWKSQTMDLSYYVGYYETNQNTDPNSYATDKGSLASHTSLFTDYNSGITADKAVYDNATYQALKDDPDWFCIGTKYYPDSNYSRYNRISAVETINSLPDTSAYLATAGGTNTIKFSGFSGSATDGGAINTMTEEEIAVATAKGWTVSFV